MPHLVAACDDNVLRRWTLSKVRVRMTLTLTLTLTLALTLTLTLTWLPCYPHARPRRHPHPQPHLSKGPAAQHAQLETGAEYSVAAAALPELRGGHRGAG